MKHISDNQIDEPWVCPGCGASETQYQLKVISSGRNDDYFPRYIPQIKESCAKCGRYRRFAPQQPIIIERFNDRLTQLLLPAKGRDFYER